MTNLRINQISISKKIQDIIDSLPKVGHVNITKDGFSCLDVDDQFIHRVQPLLDDTSTVKPNYFDEATHFIGAHISITYPEEGGILDNSELGQLIPFEINGLFSAELFGKKYYVLGVEAPDLIILRRRYGLSHKLQLEGHWVDLHMTVAVAGYC